MKYCLQYSNQCKSLKEADEVTIKYIEDKGLVKFLENHKHQRVNLSIAGSTLPQPELRKLIAMKKEYSAYRFAVAFEGNRFDPEVLEQLRENNIPFYCSFRCDNWETFNYYIKLGVSDINVSGALAFELPKVKRVLEKNKANIQIRITPNYCTNTLGWTNHLIGFFVRPEDIDLYAEYVDILDFYGIENQDTFYNMYAKTKRFLGNLNTCIYNLDMDIDNKAMTSLFGDRRRACGRECLSGGRCHRCYDLYKLQEIYREKAQEKIIETLKQAQEALQK